MHKSGKTQSSTGNNDIRRHLIKNPNVPSSAKEFQSAGNSSKCFVDGASIALTEGHNGMGIPLVDKDGFHPDGEDNEENEDAEALPPHSLPGLES